MGPPCGPYSGQPAGDRPPRFSAAMLRTWFQGWCTKSQFRQDGNCIWGCKRRDDSRCYAICPVVWDFARRGLRVPTPHPEDRQVTLYLLHKRWTKASRPELLRRAALVAAVYRAHNSWRCSGAEGKAPEGLLRQALSEVVRGHPVTSEAVDSVWVGSE